MGMLATTFDLYDFLTQGDLTNNIVLQDQDIVKVNPYKTRVELIGEVKRPAIFWRQRKMRPCRIYWTMRWIYRWII